MAENDPSSLKLRRQARWRNIEMTDGILRRLPVKGADGSIDLIEMGSIL
jgi:hypothetical protein